MLSNAPSFTKEVVGCFLSPTTSNGLETRRWGASTLWRPKYQKVECMYSLRQEYPRLRQFSIDLDSMHSTSVKIFSTLDACRWRPMPVEKSCLWLNACKISQNKPKTYFPPLKWVLILVILLQHKIIEKNILKINQYKNYFEQTLKCNKV